MRVITAAVAAAVLAVAGSAAAQMPGFPAKPDEFTPRLQAQIDAPLAKLSPVTDQLLRDPPPGDWLMWRRTYNSWGYSPLDQINRSNVKQLRLAWAYALPPGPTENTPLAHDGVLFVQSYGDGVQAFNAVTGDLLWQFRRPLAKGSAVIFKRMIALADDKVLLATSDRHLVALEMKTGKPVWDVEVKGEPGSTFTSGPMALNGKAIIGMSNCVTSRCFITAVDLKDGHELWRFYTVAAPNEPGGDTWNGLPVEERYGGSSWTSGSYDPKLNLLYWGVGQPYPWNPFAGGRSPRKPGLNNDALYTDNTLALDPETGKLVWHYAHLPNDSWDLDYVFERTLIPLQVNGREQEVAVTAGKMAILEGLDARTGKFLFAQDMGIQTVVSKIDPKTGAKTINPEVIPELNKQVTFCPHPGGGRSPAATAYDPQTGLLYMPLQEHCTLMTALPKEPGDKTAESKFILMLKPGSDGKMGRLDAVDLQGHKVAWSHRERPPQSTSALPTAGGLVFEGALDRSFKAYDARTGEVLWSTRLSDTPNASPISFMADGRQYIAVTVGNGSPFTHTWVNLVPDMRMPAQSGAAIYVFEVPQ